MQETKVQRTHINLFPISFPFNQFNSKYPTKGLPSTAIHFPSTWQNLAMENHTWKTMFSNSKLGFFIAMLHIYSTGICIPITGPWRKKQTLQVISAIPQILWLKQITYKVVPIYKLGFRTGAPCTRVPFRTPNTPRTAQGPSHR